MSEVKYFGPKISNNMRIKMAAKTWRRMWDRTLKDIKPFIPKPKMHYFDFETGNYQNGRVFNFLAINEFSESLEEIKKQYPRASEYPMVSLANVGIGHKSMHHYRVGCDPAIMGVDHSAVIVVGGCGLKRDLLVDIQATIAKKSLSCNFILIDTLSTLDESQPTKTKKGSLTEAILALQKEEIVLELDAPPKLSKSYIEEPQKKRYNKGNKSFHHSKAYKSYTPSPRNFKARKR